MVSSSWKENEVKFNWTLLLHHLVSSSVFDLGNNTRKGQEEGTKYITLFVIYFFRDLKTWIWKRIREI